MPVVLERVSSNVAELARAFLLAMTVVAAAAAPTPAAAREPAPITYAGRSGSAPQSYNAASLDLTLAGGGEGSYGYGAARAPAAGPAMIDLRTPRGAAPNRQREALPVREDETIPVNSASEQGAEPWLERERVGPPYEAGGQWYVPTPEPGYAETGHASWYGADFHGRATASGEAFDQTALTAAHPTLPIPSLVQVTNLENGREVILRVNDRGPFVGGRLIDVSRGAADVLGFTAAGGAQVHVRYLGPAPRHVLAQGAPTPAQPAPAPQAAAYAPAPAAPVAPYRSGPVSLLPPGVTPQAAPQSSEAPAAFEPAVYAPLAFGAYVVQVGAFSDGANAERVRSAVENAGPVTVDTRMTARGAVHRVRVGPWTSRAEAESAQRHVASLGYAEAIVAAR